MTPEEIKQFQRAVGKASWTMDLWKFAEALGQDVDHEHTKEKFRQFQELNKALSRFDPETLAKLINAVE